MDWATATMLGMAGGLIVSVVGVWGDLITWQSACRYARSQGKRLPKLTDYTDPASDSAVGLARVVLGGLAGLLLHGQVSGTISAIAIGASAPALLRQLGMKAPRNATGHGGESSVVPQETGSNSANPTLPPV